VARRTASAIEEDALDALVNALGHLRVPEVRVTASGQAIEIGGTAFDIRMRPIVTAEEADHLVQLLPHGSRPVIVVADRIASKAKEVLRDADVGYLDRRGELRIVAPSVLIDAGVPATPWDDGPPPPPLASQVARETALACLRHPDRAHGIREVAAFIDRVPSAVSKAMSGMRRAGLLTSRNEVVSPFLFDELAGVWRREPVALAAAPPPAARTHEQLHLGFDEPPSVADWVVTDTVAAQAWGVPIVATGNHPPDFYVPTSTALRRAVAKLGVPARAETRACSVAVAPVRLVCLRPEPAPLGVDVPWPIVSPIVVALDLAQDRARGREALEQWQPEEDIHVW
jgi:hypothetical protein